MRGLEQVRPYVFREVADARPVLGRVESATSHPVVGPRVRAVRWQQRGVEIEEREMHRCDSRTYPEVVCGGPGASQRPPCSHSRTSGSVRERLAASA